MNKINKYNEFYQIIKIYINIKIIQDKVKNFII